ncbi:MAG: hydrolase 2, exosortase A system-associated [Azoarcus sp.]|jgi:exosortase A-associated hydrolase 2|nr:hydrolase 2, exosortase A system-associated [Azoarcus sp.]
MPTPRRPDFTRTVFFLETPRGRRFCIATAPLEPPSGTVLYFPPFAEEMNRSRRMAALAAQAMAACGWLVLQPDPGGCGDSEGDFGDAAWQDWVEDMDSAWGWLAARVPGGRRILWSLRAGSLLVAAWLRGTGLCPDLLLWQPVLDGERHLRKFLRFELMRLMLAEAASVRPAIAHAWARIEGGEAVEIAGYTLAPLLARGLKEARFTMPAGYSGRVDMIEVGSKAGAASSPLVSLRDKFAASGVRASCCKVAGPSFWQVQAIGEAPALFEKTLLILDEARS